MQAERRDLFAPLTGTSNDDDAPNVAAISLPKLRLQLVMRRHARWEGEPIAVVAEEGPEAPLLELDRIALRRGLRPGLRQGVARSLVPELRTAVVRSTELDALENELVRGLQTFSPRIEPVSDEVGGAFFADPRGLEKLFGGLDVWASSVHRYLRARKLRASVVCGHHPWLALALARTSHGARVFSDAARERREAEALALRSLGLSEKLCEPLAMLGIETLGAFLALPNGELCTRFGREAAELHERHGERGQLPLQPVGIELPRRVQLELDDPTTELEPLLFASKTGLDRLLAELTSRGERPLALLVELHLESHAPPGPFGTPARTLTDEERTWVERLEPAEPTVDPKVWLELLRLRLGAVELPAAVLELALEAEPTHARGHQLQTLTERPKRDVLAAARALARVRATFGDGSVTKATLHDAHLPEARFRWEPLRVLPVPTRALESRTSESRTSESRTSSGVASTATSASPAALPSSSALSSSSDVPVVEPTGSASSEVSPTSKRRRSRTTPSLDRAAPGASMPLFAPSDPSDESHVDRTSGDVRATDGMPSSRSEGGVCAGSSPGLRSVLPPERATLVGDRGCSGGGAKEVVVSDTKSEKRGEVLDFDAFVRARESTLPPSVHSAGAHSADTLAPPRLETPPDRLQRRLLTRPRPLSVDDEGRPRPMGERTTHLFGPHRTSGGWWGRAEEGHRVERDYYYVETERGALYWVFFDRVRNAWFLHGYVD
ncbi:MAG: hypothetical protein H6724_18760 [Sandaracinus sp.]|nr:hypothetical protein [Sandaracinus sp.]MCB9622807.1 hypothetical protein [Sandaracinus sp.]